MLLAKLQSTLEMYSDHHAGVVFHPIRWKTALTFLCTDVNFSDADGIGSVIQAHSSGW